MPDDRLGEQAGITGFEGERRVIAELGQGTEITRHHWNAGGDRQGADAALTGLGVREHHQRRSSKQRVDLALRDVPRDKRYAPIAGHKPRRRPRTCHDQPDLWTPLPHQAHRLDENLHALVLLESAEEQDARPLRRIERFGTRRHAMGNYDDSIAAVDDRRQLVDQCLSVYDESLGAPEPPPERPILPTGQGGGPRVAQGIMDGEDSRIPRGQRQQSRVVILVNVHDLRAPSLQRSPSLEHSGGGGDRPNAAGDDVHPDPLAAEASNHLLSLGCLPSELERVGAAQHRNVVTELDEGSCLLRTVLEQEVADDQDAHQASPVRESLNP